MKGIIFIVIITSFFPTLAYADFWSSLRDRLVDQVLPNNENQIQQTTEDTSVPQANNLTEADSQPIQNVSLLRGGIVIQCGCNGNVQIGATRKSSVCASGVEQAMLCNGNCTGGGRQWASVCQ